MDIIFAIALSILTVMGGAPREPAKIHCSAWQSGPGTATDQELEARFADLKKKGVDSLLYSGGHDPETYRRVGRFAKAAGLEFQAWIATLIQQCDPKLKPEWYAVNGLGQSAYDKPADVRIFGWRKR